ncbi:hypothetical protein R1flu_020946 [Riccia fluitans]|uniref:Uncharacterized protein n=1 Tax=Riccia fluitans TaxID=41844 RepID=A0ABD1ZN57_9MARC
MEFVGSTRDLFHLPLQSHPRKLDEEQISQTESILAALGSWVIESCPIADSAAFFIDAFPRTWWQQRNLKEFSCYLPEVIHGRAPSSRDG